MTSARFPASALRLSVGLTLLALAGCDSASGGSFTPAPPPSAPAPPPGPSPNDTAEYRATAGAVAMNALAAYDRGATGAGILVAVIDSGIDLDSPEFTGRIDPASADVAEAIDRARVAGARVINLSVIGDKPPGDAIRAAVGRATAAGIVIVICAGTEAGANPQRFGGALAEDAAVSRGLVVLVGAVAANDVIAGFSNRAGTGASHYLAAVGGSTSASAPQVAGAVALLAQAFPTMTGAQIVARLHASARDAGAPGRDAIYGNGILDLSRAFD